MVKLFIFVMALFAVSAIWEYAEVLIYGYSQSSIIDAIAAIYIAYQISKALF